MYPRPEGHCFTHHIPANVITESDEQIFTYLQQTGADLVKGDLIYFEDVGDIDVFDGTEIVDLYGKIDDFDILSESKSLPRDLHVIEDGVPIKYWKHHDDSETGRGIDDDHVVWFNHHLVLDECLHNIQYGLIDGDKHAIFTTFTFNGIQYRIIFDYILDEFYDDIDQETYGINTDGKREGFTMVFSEMLQKFKLIPFVFHSYHYPNITDDHTLFIMYEPES